WRQVVGSIPRLLWMLVCRGGLWFTGGAALAACSAQAAVELTAVRFLPVFFARSEVFALGFVLLSLGFVSYAAGRLRPGAGTLVGVIAVASLIGHGIQDQTAGFRLLSLIESVSGPSAAFAGAALSNIRLARSAPANSRFSDL